MTKSYSRNILLFVLTLSISYSSAFCQSNLIKTVYFKPNSYSIDKKYEKTLNLVAKQLSSDTSGYLKVFGYADISGPGNYNDILSEKRANAVYNYLAARVKIDPAKTYITWLGESGQEVAYDLHFPLAHIQERCVDIWIKFYRKPN